MALYRSAYFTLYLAIVLSLNILLFFEPMESKCKFPLTSAAKFFGSLRPPIFLVRQLKQEQVRRMYSAFFLCSRIFDRCVYRADAGIETQLQVIVINRK